jgi:transposase
MEEKRLSYLEEISPKDWGKTPASVKKLVEAMALRVENLEKQLTDVLAVQQHLLEKAKRTSLNSSSPPSADPPGLGKKPQQNKSNKKSLRHLPAGNRRATTRSERATRS